MARLVILDLDGVLVRIKSSWGYMHSYFGSSQEGVFERYYRLYRDGRASYLEWMKADIEHLLRRVGRPIYRGDLEEAFSKVEVYSHSYGIAELASRDAAKLAIVSSGINILASMMAKELGVRYVYSNILIFNEEDALIPGGIPLVEPLKKGRVVRKVMRLVGIDPGETIYVGDSIWDLSAFIEVGRPVLYSEDQDEGLLRVARELGVPLDRLAIARDSEELLRIVRRALG